MLGLGTFLKSWPDTWNLAFLHPQAAKEDAEKAAKEAKAAGNAASSGFIGDHAGLLWGLQRFTSDYAVGTEFYKYFVAWLGVCGDPPEKFLNFRACPLFDRPA